MAGTQWPFIRRTMAESEKWRTEIFAQDQRRWRPANQNRLVLISTTGM